MQELSMRLEGKVALVTGAGRGIGLAIAQTLAQAGAAVAIQDIELPVAQQAVDQIIAGGGRAMALGGDMGDLPMVSTLVDQVVKGLGGFHILINNAAIQIGGNWLEVSPEEFLRQVAVDQVAPMMLCQSAARVFIGQKWGRVINIGSVQQLGFHAGMIPYAMSKAALNNLTRMVARELAPHGVTVNQLSPGWMNTHRNRHDFSTEADRLEKGKRLPIGRIGEPQDCAGLALLLCSDAGEYITGQTIFVDGGISLR